MWAYEHLQTKSCDNLTKIFTEIYHTPHFLCVEGIGMNLLQGLQVSEGESLWLITCCKHHIALFSLYEFFPLGFSYKVFNEAISTQGYVISSIFPHMGFWRVILWHILCKFSIYAFSYKVFDEAMPTQRYMLYHLVFPTRVFGRWYLKHIDPMVKVFLD